MWRSWLARVVWDDEVEGSSPFTPTIEKAPVFTGAFSITEMRLIKSYTLTV